MVFTGKYGKCCYLCRKRKIKCDGEKPACRRCSTHGQTCPGYPEAFLFRPQEYKVAKQASKASPFVAPTKAPIKAQAVSKAHSVGYVSLLPSLRPCNGEVALGYFMSDFLVPDAGEWSPGFLDFIPELYHKDEYPCTKLAVNAVANMAAFNRLGTDAFWTASRQNYVASLSTLKMELGSVKEALTDDALIAVLLLHLFVDMNGDRQELLNPHTQGILSLVKLRGIEQLANERAYLLWTVALTQLLIDHCVPDTPQHIDFARLQRLADKMQPSDHTVRARILALKCTQLWELLGSSLRSLPDNANHEIDATLIEAAHNALGEYDLWCEQLPDCWKDGRWNNIDAHATYAGPGRSAYYQTLAAAVLRALMCSNSITLSSKLLEYYISMDAKTIQGTPSKEHELTIEKLKQRIRTLMADLCSYIDYALDETGPAYRSGKTNIRGKATTAYQLLWPTCQIALSELSSPEQAAFGKRILGRIGQQYGIRTAILVGGNSNLIESGKILAPKPS